ncbi:hypothetical protein IFO70_22195 [Phormidium tenue FACHB-886]|nr:hypothetical protein [Phormidium tenue FACHB-886]
MAISHNFSPALHEIEAVAVGTLIWAIAWHDSLLMVLNRSPFFRFM